MLKNDPLIMFGSIKVMDGLFITDDIAAGDLEFISTNKVTRIINCCCYQVPNHWSSIGIKYLSFNWREKDPLKITEDVCNTIFEFINSVHGISNGSVIYLVAGIYLMMRFKWTINKTIDYLCVKQPCFYIAPHFHKALCFLEDTLKAKYKTEISGSWDLNRKMKKQEQIITHTFINTRIAAQYAKDNGDIRSTKNNRNQNQKSNTFIDADPNARRIKWIDQSKEKVPLAEVIVNKYLDHGKKIKEIPKIKCHYEECKRPSIIKRREIKQNENECNITSTSKDNNEPLLTNINNSRKKINESLDHIPSAKLYEQENKDEEDDTGKRKRIKSARTKDSKAKSTSKSKKADKILDKGYGAQTTKMSKEGKTIVRKHRNPYEVPMVGGMPYSSKVANNFFRPDQKSSNDNADQSSIELDDILNKGGVSDINIKKQMLINKIRNNEIDHDKYMKVIKAISDKNNEPDQESSEVSKKSKKFKQGPIAIQNQGMMPVMNFNYPPPVINTLIVNGNNFVFDFSQNQGAQPEQRPTKVIKEFGSNNGSSKAISKNQKSKTIQEGISYKRSKQLQPTRKDKMRNSYGANSETRKINDQFKQYDSLGSKEKKVKDGIFGGGMQSKMYPNAVPNYRNLNHEDILISGISPSSRGDSRPKSNKDKSRPSKKRKM